MRTGSTRVMLALALSVAGAETTSAQPTPRDSVRTNSGAYAHLRAFQSASTKHVDTVAYLQADGRVWMLELAARSRDAHDAAYTDFMSLVKSYAPGPNPPN